MIFSEDRTRSFHVERAAIRQWIGRADKVLQFAATPKVSLDSRTDPLAFVQAMTRLPAVPAVNVNAGHGVPRR
jgi:hypothetical protein